MAIRHSESKGSNMIIDDICLAFFTSQKKPYFENKEKIYVSLLIHSWIDALLTAVPTLSTIIDIDDESEFSKFVLWCFNNSNRLNWTVGISIIRYLKHINKDIDKETRNMLILFSCSQWTYENKTSEHYLFVIDKHYSDFIFCSEKSSDARISRKTYMIKNNIIQNLGNHDFYYFTLCKNSNLNISNLPIKEV